MTQHYSRLYFHVIFKTHGRRRAITPGNELVIYKAFRQSITSAGATCVIVNGVEDHIHALVQIPLQRDLYKVLRRVKQETARATREVTPDFEWSRGYAIFSVNHYSFQGLIRYIRRQKRHHKSGLIERHFEWNR